MPKSRLQFARGPAKAAADQAADAGDAAQGGRVCRDGRAEAAQRGARQGAQLPRRHATLEVPACPSIGRVPPRAATSSPVELQQEERDSVSARARGEPSQAVADSASWITGLRRRRRDGARHATAEAAGADAEELGHPWPERSGRAAERSARGGGRLVRRRRRRRGRWRRAARRLVGGAAARMSWRPSTSRRRATSRRSR